MKADSYLPVSILAYPQFILKNGSHCEPFQMLYLLTPLLKNSKGFPFYLKVKSQVLSTAHSYVRIYVICLPTAPTISDCICHSISSPLCLSHMSFSLVAYLHQAQSCLRAFPLLEMLFPGYPHSLLPHSSFYRWLSLTILSKRQCFFLAHSPFLYSVSQFFFILISNLYFFVYYIASPRRQASWGSNFVSTTDIFPAHKPVQSTQ